MPQDHRRTSRQIPRLSFLGVPAGDASAATLRAALSSGPTDLHITDDPVAILDELRAREHDAVVLDADAAAPSGGLVLAQAIRRDAEQATIGIVLWGEVPSDPAIRELVDEIVSASADAAELRAAAYRAGMEGRRRRRSDG